MSRNEMSGHHVPVFGVLLVFLGIVFLLQNLGILPWGVWGRLWQFWPVVLVAIGLNLLLRHRSPWLVIVLILVLLLACLGMAIWQYRFPAPGNPAGSSLASWQGGREPDCGAAGVRVR